VSNLSADDSGYLSDLEMVLEIYQEMVLETYLEMVLFIRR